MRRALFQVHWALGVTVGLLLVIVGVTGAEMSFESEIQAALNRDTAAVRPHVGPRMKMPQMVSRFYAAHPDATLTQLLIPGNAATMPLVEYVVGKYDEQTVEARYADPYDGDLRGEPAGYRFFRTVRQIHRWLLLPRDGANGAMGAGRWATLITTLSLIFFGLSGLYLRWPRKTLDWRT